MEQFNLFLNNLSAVFASDTAINFSFIVLASAIVFIWIGLAAFSASYVELRGGNNGTTFTLGILFPVVAPLLAILMTSGRENREQFVAGDLVHAYTYGDASTPSEEPTEETASNEPVGEDKFDLAFFKLKTQVLGPNQTYQLSMGDRVVTVNRILECLPNVLLAEMMDEDGKAQRMRIPYVKILGVRY
ncbi:MAG: hypothetical protein KAG98_05050 [Lentisphaeria bacterium]|nr:hypothetical protein [Lentisphaeria bacterium]